MADLQILISAYGPGALEKIGALEHAELPGVEYLVGWQKYDPERVPALLSERADFKIIPLDYIGLSNSRNALIEKATAPIVVIADDDLVYRKGHLKAVTEAFKSHRDAHFLTFRYESKKFPKNYPPAPFDLTRPPKNYFVTSMELAFNLEKIREDYGNQEIIRFHTAFGVNGTLFGSCEEELLTARLLRRGLKGWFVPEDVCINTESTTSERIGSSRPFIETKGASMGYLKPHTALLRMLTHAWRAHKATGEHHIPFLTYCNWWLAGARKAKINKVFENY